MAKVLGVAVDGSDIAEAAFNYAIDSLYKPGDTVVVIHVAEYNISIPAVGSSDVEKLCQEMKRRDDEIASLTATYTKVLREKGINGKTVRPTGGRPGEVIVKTCKEEDITHIVMGTRGLGAFQRAILGSVSQFVLNHTSIPVTIIPKKA
ncbi:universal stress protein in QAH/OAS sulfhydrylase 3'region-like [Haliotis cracherodii]|uniref:universal stress protein in QAH/OAS sulfhydrylase 3'region-like n=1 Tax=Haliotis cracherodii TaxID=6455 RepID=UPI0039ECC16B